MKKITRNLELDADTKLAEILKSNDNDSWIALYRVGKAILYVENLNQGEAQFLLEGTEKIESATHPKNFLEKILKEFDLSDNFPFADLEWGTLTLDDLKASPEDFGPFKIIMGRYFSRGGNIITKYEYLQDNEGNYADLEFATYKDAEDYLTDWTSGPYYLGNAEIEAPDYIITTAYRE